MNFNGRALRLFLLAGILSLFMTAACGPSSQEVDSDTTTQFCNLSLVVCDQKRSNCLDNSTLARDDKQCSNKFHSCLFAMCQSVNLDP